MDIYIYIYIHTHTAGPMSGASRKSGGNKPITATTRTFWQAACLGFIHFAVTIDIHQHDLATLWFLLANVFTVPALTERRKPHTFCFPLYNCLLYGQFS